MSIQAMNKIIKISAGTMIFLLILVGVNIHFNHNNKTQIYIHATNELVDALEPECIIYNALNLSNQQVSVNEPNYIFFKNKFVLLENKTLFVDGKYLYFQSADDRLNVIKFVFWFELVFQ